MAVSIGPSQSSSSSSSSGSTSPLPSLDFSTATMEELMGIVTTALDQLNALEQRRIQREAVIRNQGQNIAILNAQIGALIEEDNRRGDTINRLQRENREHTEDIRQIECENTGLKILAVVAVGAAIYSNPAPIVNGIHSIVETASSTAGAVGAGIRTTVDMASSAYASLPSVSQVAQTVGDELSHLTSSLSSSSRTVAVIAVGAALKP